MKQETLLEALSYVNYEYIEAAAPKARPRRRLRPWLAAAACLALAVGVFAAARLAKPAVKPEAVPQGPSPNEAAEDGPGEGPDKSDWPEPNADAQTILDYRIGGLYLGMPQQEVLDLLGEPSDRSKGDPVILEDGSARDTWWYKRSDDPERLSDFQVQFADKGDGWVVNEITVYNDFDLSLPHGIRLGMSDAELRTVWPEIAEEALYTADAGSGEENSVAYSFSSYTQSNGVQWFNVDLKNGTVYYVSLGPYYEEPPWDLDAPTPEEPYSFSSGEITVWRRTDPGWEAVQRTEHGAKVLETVFSIEELVPLAREPDGVRYVVDFQNGTVCLVCAPEEGITAGPNVPPDAWGGVYRLEDRDAFEASMTAGDTVPQGLSPLERCIFPYGTWDALGEAFE